MSKRDVVFPAGRHALYEQHHYSPAIRSNGFLFVSGQVGSKADGTPEPDLLDQVALAFKNLNAILGSTLRSKSLPSCLRRNAALVRSNNSYLPAILIRYSALCWQIASTSPPSHC